MNKFNLAIFFVILTLTCGSVQAADTILTIGDSITAGYKATPYPELFAAEGWRRGHRSQ